MFILVILLLLIPVKAMSDYSDIAEKVIDYNKKKEQVVVSKQQTGYDMTVAKLFKIKQQGAEIPKRACNTTFGIEYGTGDVYFVPLEFQYEFAEKFPEHRQQLSQGLAVRYPGSAYDCISGTGRIVVGHQEYILQNGRVKRYTQKGPATFDVFWDKEFANVTVSDSKQHISFIVNTKNPRDSYFNDVFLSITAQTQRMFIEKNKEQGLSLTKSELVRMLNSYYAQNNKNGDMISFANELILNAAFRDDVFAEIAGGLK